MAFDLEESHWEKFKKDLSLVMGPSQIILGMVNLIRKMIDNNKNFSDAFDHASKSPSCVFEPQTNSSTCHPFIGG
jgi:hypothetical protein